MHVRRAVHRGPVPRVPVVKAPTKGKATAPGKKGGATGSLSGRGRRGGPGTGTGGRGKAAVRGAHRGGAATRGAPATRGARGGAATRGAPAARGARGLGGVVRRGKKRARGTTPRPRAGPRAGSGAGRVFVLVDAAHGIVRTLQQRKHDSPILNSVDLLLALSGASSLAIKSLEAVEGPESDSRTIDLIQKGVQAAQRLMGAEVAAAHANLLACFRHQLGPAATLVMVSVARWHYFKLKEPVVVVSPGSTYRLTGASVDCHSQVYDGYDDHTASASGSHDDDHDVMSLSDHDSDSDRRERATDVTRTEKAQRKLQSALELMKTGGFKAGAWLPVTPRREANLGKFKLNKALQVVLLVTSS